MKKKTSISIEQSIIDLIKAEAKKESSSFSSMMEYMAKFYFNNQKT